MASKQMSLAEACEALGLSVPLPGDADGALPDAPTLRKVYARAIQRYSPESNLPEFQRVRAAYELIEERRQSAVHSARLAEDDTDWFKLLPHALRVVISIAVSVIVWATQATSSTRDVALPPTQAYELWMQETCRDFPSICGPARAYAAVLQEQFCPRVAMGLETFRAVAARELPVETATLVTHRAHQIARGQCPGDVVPVPTRNDASS